MKQLNDLAERFADHAVDVDPGTWNAISGQLAAAAGTGLREMLREKFTGHEAPVDPQAWANISSQLGHGAAAAGTTATWLKVGLAATVVAGGLLVYSLVDDTKAPAVAETATVTAPVATPGPQKEQATTSATVVEETPLETNGPATATRAAGTNNAPQATTASVPTATVERPTNDDVPVAAPQQLPPPTTEGTATVNAVLQDVVNNYVTSPVVVATEPQVPPPSQGEMPSAEVSPGGQPDVEEFLAEDPGATATQPATPEMTVLIPTAFSPNGDGTNDDLLISVRNYQKAAVRIFSASNNALVFAADNLEAAWNGRIMNTGQPCEPGMYFYALEITDENGRTWSKGEVVRLFR